MCDSGRHPGSSPVTCACPGGGKKEDCPAPHEARSDEDLGEAELKARALNIEAGSLWMRYGALYEIEEALHKALCRLF